MLTYLEEVGGIDGERMEAAGYGFDRPKAPNDPEFGNPVNRRVEIYLRDVDKEAEAALESEAAAVEAPMEDVDEDIK